jgi:hypothetical protein
MAIIYTYPTKATPVDSDLVLISDSADSNKTKQATIASVRSLTAGVTKIVAGTGIGVSPVTGIGDVTVNFSGGLNDLSDVSYPGTDDASIYIGNGAPSGLVGQPTKTTAVGEGAGSATTSAGNNTLIGTNAGVAVTTGGTNTLIGTDAGNTIATGGGNVILGAGANSNANNVAAGIAIGKNTIVSTSSVAIGESASATGGGIALGRGSTNTVANLALGSAAYPLLQTGDAGNVNGLATGQNPSLFIEVQIGATKYYMALYEQA